MREYYLDWEKRTKMTPKIAMHDLEKNMRKIHRHARSNEGHANTWYGQDIRYKYDQLADYLRELYPHEWTKFCVSINGDEGHSASDHFA